MLTTNHNPECDVCLDRKIHRPATTKTKHPDFAGYEVCEECARELNRREPTYPIEGFEPEETEAHEPEPEQSLSFLTGGERYIQD